jgi:hypothetical protein
MCKIPSNVTFEAADRNYWALRTTGACHAKATGWYAGARPRTESAALYAGSLSSADGTAMMTLSHNIAH